LALDFRGRGGNSLTAEARLDDANQFLLGCLGRGDGSAPDRSKLTVFYDKQFFSFKKNRALEGCPKAV
jgi:hypothetical protein